MDCAVKKFTLNDDDEELKKEFRNEVFLLQNMVHANLVQFKGACSMMPNLCIITELMLGSLANLLYGSERHRLPPEKWDDTRKINVALGVASGVAFLHSKKVCHRDLKSSNVLYDRNLDVKLCDFAFSKFNGEPSYPQNHVGRGWGIRNGAKGAVRLPKILVLMICYPHSASR